MNRNIRTNYPKILVIAYVFPPIAYAGTYRTLRLCRHLLAMGFDIDILTIKFQPDLHNDYNLLDADWESTIITRTSIIDVWRSYNKIKPKLANSLIGRIFNKFLGTFVNLVSIPDHMNLWLIHAFPAILKIMRNKHYDVIYVTSPPHSQQILGYLTKKKFKHIKWVSDLRDPLVENLTYSQLSIANRFVHRKIENAIASSADAVVFNTCIAAELFRKRYKKDNAIVIRNSFDESDFRFNNITRYKKFTISHVGSMYSFRQADLLFEAVAYLDKKKQIDCDHFSVLFVGMNNKSLKDKILSYRLEKYFHIMDMVPHKDAINIMQKSHLLLLIKGFGLNSANQIPGKLYEYLATGNQIIHIGPIESEAASIIKEQNAGITFASSNTYQLASYISSEYMDYKDNMISFSNNHSRQSFSSYNMALSFKDLFQKFIN